MKNRIAIALGIATVLAAFAGVAYAARQTGFEGAWRSVDPGPDQSSQWLWITSFAGMHEVLYYDELCSSCTGISGFGPPCTYVGAGTVDYEGNLSTDDGGVYCLWQEGAELLMRDYTITFSLLGDGSMTDDSSAVWTRSNDKDPRKVIGAWTEAKPYPAFDGAAFCAYALQDPDVLGCSCNTESAHLSKCEIPWHEIVDNGFPLQMRMTDPREETMTGLPIEVGAPNQQLFDLEVASLPGELTVTFLMGNANMWFDLFPDYHVEWDVTNSSGFTSSVVVDFTYGGD